MSTDVSSDPRWGYNPISRRYVIRTGAIWRRLVKSGTVSDPEVAAQLANPSIAAAWASLRNARGDAPAKRSNNVSIPEPAPEHRVSRTDTVAARKATKKLIADHVEELEGLPPDQVDALLRRLLAMKLDKTAEAPPAENNGQQTRAGGAPIRVKVAPTARKAPAGRRVRVADLFSSGGDETTTDFSD